MEITFSTITKRTKTRRLKMTQKSKRTERGQSCDQARKTNGQNNVQTSIISTDTTAFPNGDESAGQDSIRKTTDRPVGDKADEVPPGFNSRNTFEICRIRRHFQTRIGAVALGFDLGSDPVGSNLLEMRAAGGLAVGRNLENRRFFCYFDSGSSTCDRMENGL